MKLAWIGTPSSGGGVGGIGRLFLRELAAMRIELDVYSNTPIDEVPELQSLFDGHRTRYYSFPYSWNWDSWYGRNQRAAFVMSFLKRLPLHGRVVKALIAEHRRRPYDAVIQFSQGELLGLRRFAGEIPIVLFPCVHAAGERYWCQQEESLARRCEPKWWRQLRDFYLGYRARLQQRDYRIARGVIGMSRRFNRWVGRDYGIPPKRLGVVYHPIEIPLQEPREKKPDGRVRLLFVGRISVRKGIDQLLQILPDLLAAEPDVEVTVIGGGSLWSNYEPLLRELPTERCRWVRSMDNDKVQAEMQRSDILLIPSLYEPGGIVVGEALANGMTVVASDEVGSAENLPASVCQTFRAGDRAGFLTATLQAVARVRERGSALRGEATSVARNEFDPRRVTERLLSEVGLFLSRSHRTEVPRP